MLMWNNANLLISDLPINFKYYQFKLKYWSVPFHPLVNFFNFCHSNRTFISVGYILDPVTHINMTGIELVLDISKHKFKGIRNHNLHFLRFSNNFMDYFYIINIYMILKLIQSFWKIVWYNFKLSNYVNSTLLIWCSRLIGSFCHVKLNN